ncbi:uncharacterized protein LOC129949728 [Eupeodes corollae]|uniref:uncharacterized protein LOC129949728 n=1 Tax=Eupeodes corollae TaxID=290404 RepID=UPI0024921F1B|nr:uncharacterized protein LOC129949728 [Eupeodes corollae]
MMKQLIVALIVALCLVNTCSAIKCYSCRSTTDPRCAEEKPDEALLKQLRQVDCDTAPRPVSLSTPLPVTKCNKVITKDRAGVIVSRDCQFEEYGEDPNKCSVSHSLQVESCQICKGDLCNSATGYTAMGVMALLGFYFMTLIM